MHNHSGLARRGSFPNWKTLQIAAIAGLVLREIGPEMPLMNRSISQAAALREILAIRATACMAAQ